MSKTRTPVYDYSYWRKYFLFQLSQYRQGHNANKQYWQQGLVTLRQARNEGFAK